MQKIIDVSKVRKHLALGQVVLFWDDIEKAPTIDPETLRPVSHWILQRSIARCAKCCKGYRITNGGANVLTFSYCPNCGAKMEDEKEKENEK